MCASVTAQHASAVAPQSADREAARQPPATRCSPATRWSDNTPCSRGARAHNEDTESFPTDRILRDPVDFLNLPSCHPPQQRAVENLWITCPQSQRNPWRSRSCSTSPQKATPSHPPFSPPQTLASFRNFTRFQIFQDIHRPYDDHQ